MRVLFSVLSSLLLSFAIVPDATWAENASSNDRQLQMIGRQSSLGYRLVRSLCFAHAGIDTTRNLRVIEDSRKEIQTALQALRNGDPARNIEAITNNTIRTQLSSLEMVWKALDKKAADFLSGTELTDDEVVKLTLKAESLEKLWRNITQSLETVTSVDSPPRKPDQSPVDRNRDRSEPPTAAGGQKCLPRPSFGRPDAGRRSHAGTYRSAFDLQSQYLRTDLCATGDG